MVVCYHHRRETVPAAVSVGRKAQNNMADLIRYAVCRSGCSGLGLKPQSHQGVTTVKSNIFLLITFGLLFTVMSVLCLFAQKRVLDYFLQTSVKQMDFARSNPWCFAALGVFAAILGGWGMLNRSRMTGPTWVFVVMVLVGFSLILGYRFMAQYQYDWFYRSYINLTGDIPSWKPWVRAYTYVTGVIFGLVAFVCVSTGVYHLRH